MNNLIENILARPKAQKIGILAATVILLSALFYTYIYSAQSQEIAKLTESTESALNEKKIKQQKVANLPKLQQELLSMEVKLKEAVAQLPDRKEIPDLLSSLSTKAREAGLEILLFRPRPENLQEFYAAIPVDIVVRGGFYNAVMFFDDVGKLSRIVNIDNIELRNPKINGDQVILDISNLATTYRFLDETERKKMAEEKAKAAQAKK